MSATLTLTLISFASLTHSFEQPDEDLAEDDPSNKEDNHEKESQATS